MTDKTTPCPPPDPNPRAPHHALPADACDCHIHIVPAPERFPFIAHRAYTPAVTPLPAYEAVMRATGIARAVIVQPSFYGTDNRATLEPLTAGDDRFRAVVVVDRNVSDAELERMQALGARGVRLNIATGADVIGLEDMQALAPRLRRLGWHLQVFMRVADFVRHRDALLRLELPLVVDHMGVPAPQLGIVEAGFRRLVASVATGECWVKLSGAYRMTRLADGSYADSIAFAHALAAANPRRCLWGSDWPHPHFDGPMPNDGTLLDLLAAWVPDAATRRRILVDNPATLYGWAGD